MDTAPRIGFLIRTLSHRIGRTLDQKLRLEADGANTSVRSHILGYFAHRQIDSILQSDLARHFMIQRSTMTNILDGLEKEGLVTRQECKSDKRQKYVMLTDRGKLLCRQRLLVVDEFESELRSTLTDEELDKLLAIAKKLERKLDTYTC